MLSDGDGSNARFAPGVHPVSKIASDIHEM